MGFHFNYWLGLDLGQRNDYTALALLEEPCYIPDGMAWRWNIPEHLHGWVSPELLSPAQIRAARADYFNHRPGKPPLTVRYLERVRGQPYPGIVQGVKSLLERAPFKGETALIVDTTGVGRGVVDMLDLAGLRPIRVTITGGNQVGHENGEYTVPKRDLVAAVQVGLQTGRLKIAPALEDAQLLTTELQNFQISVTAKAHDTYNAREGEHDDLVLATALAAFYRDFYNLHSWNEVEA